MPDGLLAWYKQHAEETGRSVNALLVAAVEQYRTANSGATTPVSADNAVAPLSIGGTEIPVTVDDRQPPGIVSVIAPGEEKTDVRSFALAPEEAAPAAFRKPRAKGPCEHRVRPGSYCTRCGHLI
jgi:hypothetical protein